MEAILIRLQGDPFGRGKGFVGIKFSVPFQYKPLVLKRNFKMGVNKNHSMTIRVTLYQLATRERLKQCV